MRMVLDVLREELNECENEFYHKISKVPNADYGYMIALTHSLFKSYIDWILTRLS